MKKRIWVNIKNKTPYLVIDRFVKNATNGFEDQLMVLYQDRIGHKYVREINEFEQKFNKTAFSKFEQYDKSISDEK